MSGSENRTLEELQRTVESLQRQLEEAQASNKAKEAFLSNMSHDIRTPMNAIVGMTQLAKKHIDEKARVADALNKIETASSHLLSLINEVLDMSRIDSGRMNIAAESFSLSDLLHDVVTIIQPQMVQKNHRWTLSSSGIVCEQLIGDALRLRQVYVNIINNAVKYTPDGGQIDLSVSESVLDGLCHLSLVCRDNGIGMSEEFLSRIYDPFERAGSTTVTRIEGTGLGMSIVRKIVEAMNGSISITSRLGEGTEVTITVPLPYEEIRVDHAAVQDKNLLILEANPVLISLYDQYLDEFGIAHTIVPSASAALSVLTDADFGKISFDGLIIGREQKESGSIYDIASYFSKAHPDLPVILISEDSWDEIRYHANRSGIHHFIPLPIFRKSLINGLDKVFSGENAAQGASLTPDLTGRRILLAEDNFINLEIAKEILRSTKAEIDTAENGQEAVACFSASSEGFYSLILMDIQMPVMDGYEACRAIRRMDRKDAGTVPILAMTANTFAEDIARAKEAGMNGHIAKPVDINALMQALRQALR
ncbi:MAG: response regulator [Lachnospiraceae bacterium]|nr:response regulator [Lachnospiraceae bacterium]